MKSLIITFLLVCTLSWSIDFGPNARQEGLPSGGRPNCAAHFVTFLRPLLLSTGRIGISSFAGLPRLLQTSGLSKADASFFGSEVEALLNDKAGPPVLRAVGKAVTAAKSNAGVLGLCILGPDCKLNSVGTGFYFSTKFPAMVIPFSEEGVQSQVKQPLFKLEDFWQGVAFQPSVSETEMDYDNINYNLKSLFHELGYFEAGTGLARWVTRVQTGAFPHKRLENYISADGKVVDEGFISLLRELRGTRSAFEASYWFLHRQRIGANLAYRMTRNEAAAYIPLAIGRLTSYGPNVQRALDDFDVTAETFWDRSVELGDLLELNP